MNADRRYFIALHPAAERSSPRRFAAALQALRAASIPFELARPVDGPDLVCLTHKALREGYSHILAMGGDGTLHLCAQAFMENGRNLFPKATLVPLKFGTGNDFYRGFIPRHEQGRMDWLGRELVSVPISLGEILGRERRYFINSFSLGITPVIVQHYLNSRARSYFLSTIASLHRHRGLDLQLEKDGALARLKTLLFIICKGSYVGGGMNLHAESDHRRAIAKALWVPELKWLDMAWQLPQIYRGGVTQVSGVRTFDFTSLTLTVPDENLRFEADGELYPADLRMQLRLLPGALLVGSPPLDGKR